MGGRMAFLIKLMVHWPMSLLNAGRRENLKYAKNFYDLLT